MEKEKVCGAVDVSTVVDGEISCDVDVRTAIDIVEPVVILVRPQLGENIGMSARAMGNCGVRELRLVSPRDGWPSATAVSAARGAEDIVLSARVFGSVGEAVSDCSRVLATSARFRDRNLPVHSPDGAMGMLFDFLRLEQGIGYEGVRCGVMFGPENNGLGNEDLSYAEGLIRADLADGCCSLNLSMAVFMVCWEWRRVVLGGASLGDGEDGMLKEISKRGDVLSNRGMVMRFMMRLEGLLEGRGFYRSAGQREEVKLNLRAMGMRARISEQELRTLEGVVSALTREKRN